MVMSELMMGLKENAKQIERESWFQKLLGCALCFEGVDAVERKS